MSKVQIHCMYEELKRPGDLLDHPKNRNTHDLDQVKRLAKLYTYHGIRHPIIVSRTSGFIVAGHGRKQAAIEAGLTEFPVVYQDFDSDEAEYAFIQADNAIAAWAKLDFAGINADLADLGPDFDLDMLGIRDFVLEPAEKLDPVDEDKEVNPAVVPKSARGEVYLLGDHRLMCGDSTNITDVERLMAGDLADMVFTDPPYGVAYEGGHNKKKRQGIANDTLAGDDLTDLFASALSNAEIVTAEHAPFYIWYANGKVVETMKSFSQLRLQVRAVLCWYKVRSGLGAFMAQYIPNYEPCIYAHKVNCSPQWFGPTDEKTVWELQKERVNDFHPTQKPVELCERAIRNSSKEKQRVLDLFGGSGSTLIACENLGRKARLMEIDPLYVDVIIRRWQELFGQQAVREDGLLWDSL